MVKRRKIEQKREAHILDRGRRRCPVCFALNGISDLQPGQISHLDHNPSNNDPDNIAFLCLVHHDQYDGKTSQSKGLTIAEVKEYRSLLDEWIMTHLPIKKEKETERKPESLKSIAGVARRADEKQDTQGNPNVEMDENAKRILRSITEAKITRSQSRILGIIVEQYSGMGLPRRLIESRAGYEYLSSEFQDEMSVLLHHSFVLPPDDSDQIYLRNERFWKELHKYSEKSGNDIIAIIQHPDQYL
jgi:hypothetical protein